MSGGKLDITNNQVKVSYSGTSPITSIVSSLASGYNSGGWNGTSGILSSLAAGQTSVGVVDNGSSVTIAYTLGGDSDLNQTVDFNDLLVVGQNYDTTGKIWGQGDFNYDGNVDFNDLLIVGQNYDATLTLGALSSLQSQGMSPAFTSDVARAFSSVPEPTSLCLLAVGGLGLLAKRRRHA